MPIQRTGLRARDPLSGFFFVRRDCLDGIPFLHCGFKLLLEILVRARVRSLEEIPFAFGVRFRGSSKANLRVACDYARLLARLYRLRFGLGRLIRVGSRESVPATLGLFDEPHADILTQQSAAEFQEDH